MTKVPHSVNLDIDLASRTAQHVCSRAPRYSFDQKGGSAEVAAANSERCTMPIDRALTSTEKASFESEKRWPIKMLRNWFLSVCKASSNNEEMFIVINLAIYFI